jgi:16S rRNA (guanine1207-N2)-methyltransferase
MSHYFSNDDTAPLQRRQVSATIWGRDLDFTTAGGVFSTGSLDLGTAVLLRTYPPPTSMPRILDLGCGWGAIAVAIAVLCPEVRVDAVDVNDRALALCAENATAHGVADRVRTLRPEQVEADALYDEIWSNPPIRIGKDALHELLLSWLPRLDEDGAAKLVVGRNRGADTLQRWLVAQGYQCERAASAKGFRVLEVAAG